MSMKYGSAAMADKIAFTFPAAPAQKQSQPDSVVTEKHFSVQELAAHWGLGEKTIRNMFWDEPGVLKVKGESGRYVTLRIPVSVAQRVHQKASR